MFEWAENKGEEAEELNYYYRTIGYTVEATEDRYEYKGGKWWLTY